MKKQITKYYIVLLMALIFAAPGIAAYVLYQHPSWLGSSRINKGILLTSPLLLPSLNHQSKWQIIFWSPDACDTQCIKQIDMLARVRLALGRKLYSVDQELILGDAVLLPDAVKKILKEHDFHLVSLTAEDRLKLKELSPKAAIFIANADNFLVMRYASDVNPDHVYKDIKLLLNATEKKGGV